MAQHIDNMRDIAVTSVFFIVDVAFSVSVCKGKKIKIIFGGFLWKSFFFLYLPHVLTTKTLQPMEHNHKNTTVANGVATVRKPYETPEIECILLAETPKLLSASETGAKFYGVGRRNWDDE